MTRRLHLNAFMMYTPMMHSVGSWGLPDNEVLDGFNDPEFWQDIARILERGNFDMVFFGDHLAPYDVYKSDPAISIRYGLQFPVHDPLLLVPWMAAATQRLGFGVTLSTAFYQPYLLTRKLATLDHLTRGRMAWNVVTSAQENESKNMGLGAMLPHDERYDRADEYMELCHQLWRSWQPGAVIADSESLTLADPEAVRTVHHDGKYFTVHAPSSVTSSPQVSPVIMQAGGSPRGRDFAARHAEVIFAIKRNAPDMKAFVDDMTERAASLGRSRDEFKVIFGAEVVQAETHEQAEELRRELNRNALLEPSLAKLSGLVGVDLSAFDPDLPVEQVTVPGAQGLLDVFAKTTTGPVTLRQAATEYGASAGNVQFVGTAAEIADEIASVHEDGGGDGFNLTPITLPGAYRDFVEKVVPLLQSRGLVPQTVSGSTLRERLFEGA